MLAKITSIAIRTAKVKNHGISIKSMTKVGLWLNLHAFVDGRIQVLIETYSYIVTVVRSAYSKLRFDRNNDI